MRPLTHAHAVQKLEARLGVVFQNRDLLIEALTHRSYLNEHPDHHVGHNERLEFLGDAVLEIIVTEHLFRKYPKEEEGRLTDLRTRLVNGDQLGSIAKAWELDDCLLMSRGQAREPQDGKARKFILANAFEAILGALYLDQGIGSCRLFVDAHLLTHLSAIFAKDAKEVDAKTTLQNLVQERFNATPVYRVISESGPKHEQRFIMSVFSQGKELARAEGLSKHEAAKAAARRALETIEMWENRLVERERRRSTERRS